MAAAMLVRQGWTQGAMARASYGKPCSPFASEARKWCLWGAVTRAILDLEAVGARVPDDADSLIMRELELELKDLPIFWQEHPDRTQEEVLELLWPPKEITPTPTPPPNETKGRRS